jgi:Mrp family chromosome partitioning ATPase
VVSPEPRGAGQSGGGESAFSTYLPAIRAHWVLVALVSLAALAGALATLSVLNRNYEATAQLVVAPLHATDEAFVGVGLLRETGDPARTLETAARLVESPRAADLTAERLGPGWDRKRVLARVRVETRRQSNLLAVVGTARSAALAARLANEFADSALAVRERVIERQLRTTIARLRSRLRVERAAAESESGGREIVERMTALDAALAAEGDPTLSLAQSADAPNAPTGIPPSQVLMMALLGGLVLGALAAVVVDSLDRRVRDQEDLLGVYPLPILAAVPRHSPRARSRSYLSDPDSLNGFHTVRAQLQQLGRKRAILITSASAGDGRTTTATGLALAMVEAGQRVLLMDLDVRKPDLAERLGIKPEPGRGSPFDGESPVSSLVVEAPGTPNLLMLPAVEGGRAELDAYTWRLPDLLSEALDGLVDYVIMDTPPLAEASDVLRLAGQVDDVVMVVRPGHTERGSLGAVRDLLERSEVFPVGMVVVGPAPRADISVLPPNPPRARSRGRRTVAS